MNHNTDLGKYAARDWQAVASQDRLHWLRQYRQHGPEATMGASLTLWEHVRQVRPEWPTARERQEDLDHHLRLKQIFQRAANTLAAD